MFPIKYDYIISTIPAKQVVVLNKVGHHGKVKNFLKQDLSAVEEYKKMLTIVR